MTNEQLEKLKQLVAVISEIPGFKAELKLTGNFQELKPSLSIKVPGFERQLKSFQAQY